MVSGRQTTGGDRQRCTTLSRKLTIHSYYVVGKNMGAEKKKNGRATEVRATEKPS